MNTQEEEPENIDQSVWLPEGSPIITPERLAKGDLTEIARYQDTEHVRFAQAMVMNIMNFLYERDILDDEQIYWGRVYEIWRRVFMVFAGVERGGSSSGGQRNRATLREHGFYLICRKLHVRDITAVNTAIEQNANYLTQSFAIRDRAHYERAFYNLGRHMPDIQKVLDDLKEGGATE